MRRIPSRLALLALLVVALPAGGSPPAIPDQVPFSATIPGGGTGVADLTVRIYDAASGGTLLYVQDFTNVATTDGAFSIALGPTGRATDTPTAPLTTNLGAALTGDLAAGTNRFLEVTVTGSPALPRTRVLAVPYALRAGTAETSETAGSVVQVGGVPPEVLGQIYANTNLDGGGPPNADPSEGTADVDGDGIANFVDPDNDGDGFPDTVEISQGTGMNAITPNITGFSPSSLPFGVQGTVQVQGTGFEPGISVVFGSQTPTPTNVTPTHFDVLVGPQIGPVTVTVTRLNGEARSAIFPFGGGSSSTHSTTPVAGTVLDFDVFSIARALVGRGVSYGVDTNDDGAVDTTFTGSFLATAWSPAGRVAVVKTSGCGTAALCYAVDSDGDFDVNDEPTVPIETGTTPQHASLGFDLAGRPVVGYLRTTSGNQAMLAHDLNGDGDFADVGEIIQLQSYGGAIIKRSELAIDGSGRVAFTFLYGASGNLRIAWDRNGDGDFSDTIGGTPEIATVGGVANTDCLGLTFDSAGRLAVGFQLTTGAIELGRDLNGDGDVNDAGEITVIAGSGAVCDVRRSGSGGLDFAYGGQGLIRLHDGNNDGDFNDSGESVQLLPASQVVDALEIGGDRWLATQTQILLGP